MGNLLILFDGALHMTNYEKNLQKIKNRTPDFANFIEQSKDVDWIDEMRSTNNDVNFVIRTSTEPFLIDHKDYPIEAAKEKAQENNYHNDSCSVIFGIGTGYFTKAVLDRIDKKHVVVVVEPVIHILKIALRLNDYSEAIKKGSLLFACTRDDLDYQLALVENSKSISRWIIHTENYTKHRPNEYSHLLSHTMMLITQLQSNTGTVIGAGSLIAKNDILNLPYVIKHRGVAELKDLFKDKPAILVSTGPSLNKNIHLLMDKEVQNRFIIIAVGQALRILLSYNIKPDFICSVDFGPVNFGHYKGLLDIRDIPLVSINRTYQPILKHWEGPKFISVSLDNLSTGTLSEFMAHKGGLLQGGSVSHMNLGLAINLGCNPIIIIGQDLAYTDDDRSHHSLTDEAGKIDIEGDNITWKVDDPRSEIQGDHNMGPVQLVNGYYGKVVRTNSGYVSFISTFERIFRSFPDIKFINATEGGAKLEGAECMTLEEVIEHWGTKFPLSINGIPCPAESPIDKSVLKPLLTEVDNSKELVDKSINLIKTDIEELKDIIKSSQKCLNILRYLKGKNTDRKKLAKRLAENYTTTIETKKLVDKNPLISMSVFWAGKSISQNRYSSASQEIKDALKDTSKNDVDYFYTKEGKEVLKIRIKANEIVMKASNTAAKDLLKDYEKTLKEMEYLAENRELKPFKSINPAPHLDDAKEYFKNGNWGHNLIECERILNLVDKDGLSVVNVKQWQFAKNIKYNSLALRNGAVKQAKENYDREGKDKIIKYNHYLEQAHKAGKTSKEGVEQEPDFKKALEYLEKAIEFDPDRPEAKWGIATTFYKLSNIEQEKGNPKMSLVKLEQAISIYHELVNEYPDNLQFKFELGLVHLNIGEGAEADKLFSEIFEATTDYDWFLKSLAELYFKAEMIEEAKVAIDLYCDKFQFDPKGIELKKEIYES